MADPKATAAEDVTLVGLPPLADVHENSLNDGEEQSTRSVLTTRTTPSVISEESVRSRRGTGYNADIVGPSPSIPPTYRRPRRYHDTSHDRNAMAAVLQGMVRGKNTRRVGGRHGSLIAAARGLTSEHEAGGAAAPTGGAEASCATQVGGHAGSFEASSAGHLVKETNHKERRAYEAISADAKLAAWAPKYDGSITCFDKNDPTQIDTHHVKLRLQDVTRGLRAPCVMDIKLGTRTFAESEVADTRCRKDLVEKMLKLDGHDLTEDERRDGVSKLRCAPARPPRGRIAAVRHPAAPHAPPLAPLRYMQFRERVSSTAAFGWRIEGIATAGGGKHPSTKQTREPADLLAALGWFLRPDAPLPPRQVLHATFLAKLRALRVDLAASDWFTHTEIVGSSILLVYDAAPLDAYNQRASRGHGAAAAEGAGQSAAVYMIDFAKALPSEGALTHTEPWVNGNREDGYLAGLDSLIDFWRELEEKIDPKPPSPEVRRRVSKQERQWEADLAAVR